MSEKFLQIEIRGLRDVQGRFARVESELQTARREELRNLGRRVVEKIRAEAPVRTGRLRKGITFKTLQNGTVMRIGISSAAPYTLFVIRGRGPIVAKNAKALRFEPGPPGSGFIFRRRVGPAKANPFVARAMAQLGDEPTNTARRIGARLERAYAFR